MPSDAVVIPAQHPLDIVRKAVDKMVAFDALAPGVIAQHDVIELLAYLSAARDVLGSIYQSLLSEVQRLDPSFRSSGQFVGTPDGRPIVKVTLGPAAEEIN